MMPARYPLYAPPRRSFGTAIGGVDAGECDQPVWFGWPSDVDAFKARLGPIMESTDKAAWATFIAGWRTFASQKTPLFGSRGEWVTTCTYARNLDAWIAKLKSSSCAIVGPAEIQGNPNFGVSDTVKWLAVGTIAIAAVTGLVLYAPEIKAALSRGKGKAKR
jgi:hypothetical protein